MPEPSWNSDLMAMWRGWTTLIKGKLYYDAKTLQYYDSEGKRLTYGEVSSQFNVDPMNPMATPQEPTKKVWEGSFAGTVPEAYQRPYRKATPQTEWGAGYEDLWAQAEAIAAKTGVPVAEVFASLTGTPLPKAAEAEGMSEWQQWQAEFQEKQLTQQRWEKRQDVRQSLWQAQTQRWAKEAGRPREDMAEKSRIWQAAQRERVAGLTGAENWIKRFEIEQMRDPYAPPESNVEIAQEHYDETKAEYTRRKAAANIMKKRMKDPQDPLSQVAPERKPTPEQWYAQQVLRAERTAEDQFLRAESELEGETYSWGDPVVGGYETAHGWAYGLEGGTNIPKPWHPETPEWLQAMYPERGEKEMWGTQRGGKPAMLGAPSGQAWGKLAPSQQMGWMGYAKHTGAKPLDLLTQMQKMLPQEPQIARRWQPARQYA